MSTTSRCLPLFLSPPLPFWQCHGNHTKSPGYWESHCLRISFQWTLWALKPLGYIDLGCEQIPLTLKINKTGLISSKRFYQYGRIIYGDTSTLHFPLDLFQAGSQAICIPLSWMSKGWKAEATWRPWLFPSIVRVWAHWGNYATCLRGKREEVPLFTLEEINEISLGWEGV